MSTTTLDPPRSALARAVAPDRPDKRRASATWRSLAVTLVPAALAVALVLYELSTRSLWLDESASVAIASQHGSALWSAISHDGGNLLGFYLILHVLIGWFGHAPELIRAPSAVATVITVALTAQLGRRLFDWRAGLAAGIVAAVSLPLVFWGQDARGYTLMLMFIVASFLALVRLIDGPPPARWPALAYGACLALAIYMSFVAVLVVPAQLLVLVWRRERARSVIAAVVATGIACAPIAVLAAQRGSGQLFWVPAPDLNRVGEMLRWLTSAGMPPNFHRTATGTVLLVLTLLALARCAIVMWRRPTWQTGLVLLWLLVPIGLILLESVAGQPVALARTSLVALPAVALLLAGGLSASRLGLAALGVLVVLRALQLAPSYGASPENWHAATHYVAARAAAGDCIAFYPEDGQMAFQYYGGGLPRSVLPAASWASETPYVERYVQPSSARAGQIARSCSRLWLIASHEGQRDGPPGSRANLARYVALQAALARAGYRHRVAGAKFGWASPVRVQLLSH
ncbi:MAG: glycosyltransferase family 39 protein [Solirubrobacteraceae bacterium]